MASGKPVMGPFSIVSRGKGHTGRISGNLKEGPADPSIDDMRVIEELLIDIDLDYREEHPHGHLLDRIADLLGMEKVTKEFDLLQTAEGIVRSLSSIGYSNIIFIEIDDRRLYEEPDDEHDIDRALNEIEEWIPYMVGPPEKVKLVVLSTDPANGKAEIDLTKHHFPWKHDIMILFGSIRWRDLMDLMERLKVELRIKDLETEGFGLEFGPQEPEKRDRGHLHIT